MAVLGPNVDGAGLSKPISLRWLGSRWARGVAKPEHNIFPWLDAMHAEGLKTCLVIANESADGVGLTWGGALALYKAQYGDVVDAWQLMNEPDAGWDPITKLSPAKRSALTDEDGNLLHAPSWTMTQAEVSKRLKEAREVLGPDAFLVSPGYSSGHWEFARDVDHGPVNAIACHPYAKEAGSTALDDMIGLYWTLTGTLWQDEVKQLWVTEYDSRTLEMHQWMANDTRISVALAFCYSDATGVAPFGMLDHDGKAKASLTAFIRACGVPIDREARTFTYQLGFKDAHDSAPHLVGQPRENEYGPVPGVSLQKTANGTLFWADLKTGPVLFYLDDSGDRYLWNGTELREVAA